MKRGRPVGSEIRENLKVLIELTGPMTGYDLSKRYMEKFKPCTQRSIYYHLKRGVDLGDFVIEKVVSEEGDYSWGPTTQKIYYRLK